MQNKRPEPILVAELFSEMREELLVILKSLTDDEWQAPTVCDGWDVKDVALHLLGDGINLLSNWRDKDGQWGDFDTWEELVDYINLQNDLWVRATRRMSRRILISQLEMIGHDVNQIMLAQNPYEMWGSVGWTGNETDPRWLHIAREYTEYWMHHQHICEAVNRVSLKSTRYMSPLLNTFAYSLPQTYKDSDLTKGTVVQFIVEGDFNRTWYIINDPEESWQLYSQTDAEPNSVVIMNADTAWRMFTNGIAQHDLKASTTINGNVSIGQVLLNTVGIIT